MNNKKIIFHSNKEYNSLNRKYLPVPASRLIPEWYSSYSKFLKDDLGNIIESDAGDRYLTFKTCPALLDMFITGYFLVTPCDLKFSIKKGLPFVEVPEGYSDFCEEREKMQGFSNPTDYYDKHFHWYPNWAPELPEGYSALYLNPINRYDLPFHTIGGIIDNDKMSTPGNMPFFLKKGFEGILPEGTPYVLIIPFKRDEWIMETKYHNQSEIYERSNFIHNLFRSPENKHGGGYKKHMWSRKKFE